MPAIGNRSASYTFHTHFLAASFSEVPEVLCEADTGDAIR